MGFSDAPAGSIRVIQFTDTHLFADPAGRLLGVTTQESLEAVVNCARARHWPPDLVLATGDLVHDASPAGYRRLKALLEALDVPVCALPGNHDEAAALQSQLDGARIDTRPCVALDGWAFVGIDTSVAHSDGGHVAPAELERLRACLERQGGRHVLLAMHHPPVAVGSRWMDTMVTDNPEDLFAVLEAFPNVRLIVCGHVHQIFESEYRGVRILTTPSTCFQFLPNSAEFGIDPVPPGYRWFVLKPDGSVETGVERIDAVPAGLENRSEGY